MKSLYESLLDDEDDLLNKQVLNIFDIILKSKTENEFYEKINILKDLCIAVDINDKLGKYKNSFFLMELVKTYNNNKKENLGVKIDKYFKNTKNPLYINFLEETARWFRRWADKPDISVTTVVSDKHTFNELKHHYSPTLKSDVVYVFPKNIEKQYIEWVQNLTNEYLTSAEKNKVI